VIVNNSPAAAARLNAQRRKVALLLRGLSSEVRDNLVKSIAQQDAEVATALQNLMVLWEDIPLVNERNLQTVMRSVDARKLALALMGTTAAITDKIRANISERARAMIDEETSLMKKPKADEVETARETILGYLRQLNASGELQFEGS
jgi:flagellar motor switch protein FliG